MSVSKAVHAWMRIIKLEHVEVLDGQNFMRMQTSPEVRVIEYRGPTSLAGLVHVVLQDFGPVVVFESPGHQSAYIHGSAVNRGGYFFSGHEQKIVPHVTFQLDRGRIDELVVLTKNKKVVSAVVIPLGNRIRFGVGVTAQRGVHMSVTFVPLVGPKKAGEQEEEVEQSNRHAWNLHESWNSVNGWNIPVTIYCEGR